MSSGEPRETAAEGSVPRIVQTDDVLGGQPRIEGRRVGVYRLYCQHEVHDRTVTELAEAYQITVAEVHAALAYAEANPDRMAEITERLEQTRQEREGVVTPE